MLDILRKIIVKSGIVENYYQNQFKDKIIRVADGVPCNAILETKVAVVVGATGGIGKEICYKFIKAGAEVVGIARNKNQLDALNKKLGENFHEIIWDVTQLNRIFEIIDESVEITKKKQFDIWVNCAGVLNEGDWQRDFLRINEKEYDLDMLVNLKTVYFTCQKVIQYYCDNNIAGHILNIASNAGMKGAYTPYSLSKLGVISLTRGLGRQFVDRGIIVNGIAPGPVATKMMRIGVETDIVFPDAPNGRMALPGEVANLATYLVSDYANEIVGEVVVLDGGDIIL